MEQLVILVVIGLISLVNWLIQRSAERRGQRKQEREGRGIPEGDPFRQTGEDFESEEEPPPAPPVADPAGEMRKLMEALGIPLETGEPPRPEPRKPLAPPKLPPPVFVPSAKPVVEKPLFPPASAAPLEIAPRTGALRNSLHSRDSVRRAVVLREILGPPKAFTL